MPRHRPMSGFIRGPIPIRSVTLTFSVQNDGEDFASQIRSVVVGPVSVSNEAPDRVAINTLNVGPVTVRNAAEAQPPINSVNLGPVSIENEAPALIPIRSVTAGPIGVQNDAN